MSTPYSDLLAALPAQPKTRLVTGVAGFIGSNLLETLLERDQTVAGLDQRPRQPPGRDLGNRAAVNQVYTVAVGERTMLNTLLEAIRETRAPRYPHLREVQKKHLSSTPHSSAASPSEKIILSPFILLSAIRDALAPRFPHLREVQPHYRDFRPGDVRHSLADIKKAERLLRYVPGHRLGVGLAEAIKWYEHNLKGQLDMDRNAGQRSRQPRTPAA